MVVPRPIQVYVGETTLTNDSGVELIEQSRKEEVSAWSYEGSRNARKSLSDWLKEELKRAFRQEEIFITGRDIKVL